VYLNQVFGKSVDIRRIARHKKHGLKVNQRSALRKQTSMADALQVINGRLQRLEVYMKQLLEAAQYDRSEMHVNELLHDEVHE
jgi:hypothetical protein